MINYCTNKNTSRSPPHAAYNSKISSNVEAVILKALSPEPADRFEHMLKFSDAYLRALMGFPFEVKKTIAGKQSIQPTLSRPTHQSKKSAENSTDTRFNNAEDTPPLSDKLVEELSIMLPPYFGYYNRNSG